MKNKIKKASFSEIASGCAILDFSADINLIQMAFKGYFSFLLIFLPISFFSP